MNIDNKLFTLSNGKEYMVLESLDFEGIKYAYLSNVKNELDTIFVTVNVENGLRFEPVDKEDFSKNVLPLFLEKFASYEDAE